ncbi:MAG: hypothetical protein WAM11_03640 [Cyanobium sp.]
MTRSVLRKSYPPTHPALPTRAGGLGQAGFTILEVLLAAVIAVVSASILFPMFNQSVVLGRQSADRNSIEAATALDLGWIKRYAKFWKMKSGPYPLTNSHTKTNTNFFVSPVLDYECANSNLTTTNLSQQFISDAVIVAGTTDDVIPKLPYAFSATANAPIPVANIGPGYTLSRSVDTSNPNRVYVIYKVTSTSQWPINFVREASVVLESVAWCTTT